MEPMETMEPSTGAGAPGLSFSYTPSPGEMLRATWASILRGSAWRWMLGCFVAFVGIPGVVGLLGGDSLGDALVYVLACLAFVAVALPVVGWWVVRRTLRSNPAMLQPHRIELERDGYRLRGPSMDVRRTWAVIARMVETRAFFLFFLGPSQAFYLPKRSVPPERLDEVRAFIEERLRAPAPPPPAAGAPSPSEPPRGEEAVLRTTYTLDEREMVRAARDIGRGTPGAWKWAAFFVGMPVLLMWLSLRSGATLGEAVLTNAFWVILFPAYLLLAAPLVARWEVRAQLRAGAFAGPQSMAMTAGGVLVSSAAGESRIPWEGIVSARETREFLLLYFNRRQALFIPLRAVAEGDLPAARALLRARLPGRVRVREAPSTYPRKHRR